MAEYVKDLKSWSTMALTGIPTEKWASFDHVDNSDEVIVCQA